MDFTPFIASPSSRNHPPRLLIAVIILTPLLVFAMPLAKLDSWIGWIGKILFGIIGAVFILGANLFFISGAYNKVVKNRSATSDEEIETLGDVIVCVAVAVFFASVTLLIIVCTTADVLKKLF